MNVKRGIAAAAALFSALAVSHAGAAVEEPTGNVIVRISMEDGGNFEEGTVFIKDRQVKLKEGARAVSVLDLPVDGYGATVEAFVSQGWLKPKIRYLGVGPVRVEEAKTVSVDIVLRPVEAIDPFCSSCHPAPGEQQEWGGKGQVSIRRDLHASGQPMEERYLKKVKAYNEKTAKLIRDGVPHAYPMPLEEHHETGKGKQIFYTCESCHTLHSETPYGAYVRIDFKTRSALCVACH